MAVAFSVHICHSHILALVCSIVFWGKKLAIKVAYFRCRGIVYKVVPLYGVLAGYLPFACVVVHYLVKGGGHYQ